MNLSKKYQELIMLLTQFINGTLDADVLQKFVWEVIDYFSSTEQIDLPPVEEFEKVFWYVVWEVQHLATDDHLEDGVAQRELKDALAFLKGEQNLPEECIGRRP
ncbi:hypothetical protein MNBD_GAMMA13-286 [hydrothermal vent metagenome]|uniref:Colicin D immunity protein domain-containing protein n=1 Tax=hydrothermal vent metagenome TaxID=652676 RepID=A0A3B0YNZ0_9ZZZZ